MNENTESVLVLKGQRQSVCGFYVRIFIVQYHNWSVPYRSVSHFVNTYNLQRHQQVKGLAATK